MSTKFAAHSRGAKNDGISAAGSNEADQELTMLRWDQEGTNFPKWIKSLNSFLLSKYPFNGTFWEKKKDFQYERPQTERLLPMPPALPDDASERQRIAHEAECNHVSQMNDETKIINNRLLQQYTDQRFAQSAINQQMYHDVWRWVSDASKDRVRSKFANFSEIADAVNKKPLALLLAIQETHVVAQTGAKKLDQVLALRKLMVIRMNPHETTYEFRERLMTAKTQHDAESLDEMKLPDTWLSAIFFNALDTRFDTFKSSILNNSAQGIMEFPTTLDSVYSAANNYKMPVVRKVPADNRVYKVEAGSKSKATPRKEPQKRESGSADKKPAAKEDGLDGRRNEDGMLVSKSGAVIKCWTPRPSGKQCGENHFGVDCPYLSEEVRLHKKAEDKHRREHKGKGSAYAIEDSGVAPPPQPGAEELYDSDYGEGYMIPPKIFTTHTTPNPRVQLLDTGCAADFQFVNNPAWAQNVRPAARASSIGVGGQVLRLTQICDTPYGEAFYNDRCPYTIWSHAAVRRTSSIEVLNNAGTFRVHRPDGMIQEFGVSDEYGGLLVWRAPEGQLVPGASSSDEIYVTTVQDNMRGFSKQELDRALLAQEYRIARAAISDNDLRIIISRGRISDFPFTLKDLENAIFIYEKVIPGLKGKAVRRASAVQRVGRVVRKDIVDIPRTVLSMIELHMDIMFVSGLAFLMILAPSLRFMSTYYAGKGKGARSAATIGKLVSRSLSFWACNFFRITTVRMDVEGGLKPIIPLLEAKQITTAQASPGEHVPRIERAIRTIGSTVRTLRAQVPIKWPIKVIVCAVFFAVSIFNMVPSATMPDEELAVTRVLGVTPTYASTRICFLQPAEAMAPVRRHSMEERTTTVFNMGAEPGNITGGHKWYNPITDQIIVRSQFTVVPLANYHIALLERRADADKVQTDEVQTALTFRRADPDAPILFSFADMPADAATADHFNPNPMHEVRGVLPPLDLLDDVGLPDPDVTDETLMPDVINADEALPGGDSAVPDEQTAADLASLSDSSESMTNPPGAVMTGQESGVSAMDSEMQTVATEDIIGEESGVLTTAS
jgi:hypothetical protein